MRLLDSKKSFVMGVPQSCI